MTSVEQVPDQRWSKFDIVDKLKKQFPEWATSKARRHLTIEEVQGLLLQWLYTEAFPRHQTATVPASIRQYGVVMPGHRTMAAGWLLPVTGQVTVVPGGVMDGRIFYTGSAFTHPLGAVYPKRVFPFSYKGMEQGIFVETGADGRPQLEYFVRSNRVVES
jgi:hypothetical protein